MARSHSISPLNIFLLLFLILRLLVSFSQPLSTRCSGKNTNKPYMTNVKYILTKLNKTGQGYLPCGRDSNQAYGLFLCKAKLPTQFCRFCLGMAAKYIAPCRQRQAIVWYDACYLKIWDTNFFKKIDTNNNLFMCTGKSMSLKYMMMLSRICFGR
ncbi:Unknown protein [Striga hermonthica]|uniref:Gnk2-homologous domain-containing protein n=1 Tax=Striga hermonthica TaxID=68872 RepID=A0A9N7N211_STRHE|nr:Unknown protein [Striga hermonthica]